MRWIVTDNIYGETWRQLLEFSNIELTIGEIIRRHGSPREGRSKTNYAKQAAQARVCVLQAKEYFDAARASSLFTSPNHAYYGAVALASLVLLILGDGTKSLDFLRRDKRNNHHGLLLTTASTAKAATEGVALLEETFVEVLLSGHFANWYRALPSVGEVHALTRRDHGATGSINYAPTGQYAVPTLESISSKKRSVLDLVRYLPDLDADLQRFGINAVRSRSKHEVRYSNGTTTHNWWIHGCRSEMELDKLLEEFSIDSRFSENLQCVKTSEKNSGIVTITYGVHDQVHFSWPPTRETMNHDTISYANAPETHEIVDLYLVSYQLSMLSRYFPDIWVSCIESQCRGAKLIERAVETIIKKLPILALSVLSPSEVVISTHREPWKS